MRHILLAAVFIGAACAPTSRPAPLPAPAAPAEPVPTPPPPTEVWTRRPGVALGGRVIDPAGVRLEVLEVGADTFRVRCPSCPGAAVGAVARDAVVWDPGTPAAARYGELAEFMVAIRAAAVQRDWEAMREAMSLTFVHAPQGPDGALEAIGAWRGARAVDLARLPALLDRGATQVPGTSLWAAPPEFVGMRGYQDLRAGFMRGPGGWEWVFLVRGEL